jgi:hypothetical protein
LIPKLSGSKWGNAHLFAFRVLRAKAKSTLPVLSPYRSEATAKVSRAAQQHLERLSYKHLLKSFPWQLRALGPPASFYRALQQTLMRIPTSADTAESHPTSRPRRDRKPVQRYGMTAEHAAAGDDETES